METRESSVQGSDLSSLRLRRDARVKQPSRKGWWILGCILLLLGGAGAAYYNREKLPDALKEAIERAVDRGVLVRTAPVTRTGGPSENSLLTANGYVVARRQAGVSPKVTGRLRVLNKDLGDRVKQGEIIAELDNADLAAQLEEAKATLWVAELTAERDRKLAAESVGAQADADLSLARKKEAAARVKFLEEQIENTRVRAPFDGTIIVKNNEVGETISLFGAQNTRKSGPMFVIVDFSEFEVEADINESSIGKIAPGQAAAISLDAVPGRIYRGRLRQIVPTADRQKGTIQAKVTFLELDEKVLPEMSAKVNFPRDANGKSEPARVLVPAAAVVERGGRRIVFVVNAREGRAAAIPVEAAPAVNGSIEILSGLAGGETVVLDPPPALEDGGRVRVASGAGDSR